MPDFQPSHFEWFQDVLCMLPKPLPEELLQETWSRFQSVDIGPFVAFRTWRDRPSCHGPDIEAVRTKQMADRQINIAGASGLPPPLLPPTLSQDEHLRIAMQLQHPFTVEPAIESDLRYAILQSAILGPDAISWRSAVMTSLRKLSRAFHSMDIFLLSMRPVQHVLGMNPAFVASMVSILRWPDRSLPMALVVGFENVGDLAPSSILREIPCTNVDKVSQQFFGPESERIV